MRVKIIANIMGESKDPCGTLWFIGCQTDDIELLIVMEKSLLYKKFLNNKRAISFILIFCNLSIKMLKTIVLNAEDKSSSICYRGLLLSSEVKVKSYQYYVLVYYQVSYI